MLIRYPNSRLAKLKNHLFYYDTEINRINIVIYKVSLMLILFTNEYFISFHVGNGHRGLDAI